MAWLVYALNQSLDGFVDHDKFMPDNTLFRHFIADVRSLSGTVYGRRMYEVMRYWDTDQADWDEPERAYADVWRETPKWVVSRTLESVGPNATLISAEPAERIALLKQEHEGRLEIAGPTLAASVAELIDEYVVYLHPAVVGEGKAYFAGARPRLRLAGSERIGENAIRLSYLPVRD